MKIFVVPATYNEKDNIGEFIRILEEEVFPKIKDHEMHILVADDYSPDGTGDVVKHLMKKYKNLGLNQGERKGLGAAYVRTMGHAIEKLGADVVISIDADFQFNPHDIPKFIKKIEEGFDMVVQTRYSSGGSIPKNWPPQRKLFSITANLFVRIVFWQPDLHDWTGGFRAFKKEVFLKVSPHMSEFNGYIFQIAFLHKAVRSGFKIGEVPLHFSDRKLGNSKIAPLGYILDVLNFVIRTRIIELKRFIKFLFVGGTGFIVQILAQEISIRSGLTFFLATIVDAIFFAHVIDVSTLSQAIGAAIGAEAAILSNFFFNNYWTFQDTRAMKKRSRGFVKLLKFNLTSFGAILIQASAVWLGIRLLGDTVTLGMITLPTRIVVLIPTIVMFVIPLNYLIYNKVIWKTHHLKGER